jgi:hypothetical protein
MIFPSKSHQNPIVSHDFHIKIPSKSHKIPWFLMIFPSKSLQNPKIPWVSHDFPIKIPSKSHGFS